MDETEIFKGEENSLRMQQTYTHQFQCVYDLQQYPFDSQVSYHSISTATLPHAYMIFQVCSIQMSVDLDTVELLPDQVAIEQPADPL